MREPALKRPQQLEAAGKVEKVARCHRLETGDQHPAASLPGRDLDGRLVKRDAGHHYVWAWVEGIVLEGRDHPVGRHAGGHRPEEVGAARRRDVMEGAVEVNQVRGLRSASRERSEQVEAYAIRG